MNNPLFTRTELIYVFLIMVLPLSVALMFNKDSFWGFVLYLGIGMSLGFALSVAIVLSKNRSYEKKNGKDKLNL